jgi:hypothetical protein
MRLKSALAELTGLVRKYEALFVMWGTEAFSMARRTKHIPATLSRRAFVAWKTESGSY